MKTPEEIENELAILKSSIQTNRVTIQGLQNELNQLKTSFYSHKNKGDIHVNTKMVG